MLKIANFAQKGKIGVGDRDRWYQNKIEIVGDKIAGINVKQYEVGIMGYKLV